MMIVMGAMLGACTGANTETANPLTEPAEAEQASAITRPPAEMAGINALHEALRAETSRIRFGTQADPATVTLGPTDGGLPGYPLRRQEQPELQDAAGDSRSSSTGRAVRRVQEPERALPTGYGGLPPHRALR